MNQPDFGSADFDMPTSTSDMHDDELPLSNVDPQADVPQQSNTHTPSDLPAFDQGEQLAWRQLKIVPQGKTLPDNSQPHSFDNTITTPEWSHNQGLDDHLYNWFSFSPLNHQSLCSYDALDWNKVSKTLGDTASTVEHRNCSCIRAFLTHMILNHTDARAL